MDDYPQRRPRVPIRHDRSVGRLLPALLILLALAGCTSFGRRGPTDEKVLAARELCRLGQDAWDTNRWSEAHARFAHALELCPDHTESRRYYAQALWQRGDRDDAVTQMRQVVEQTDGEPTAAAQLGRMLLERSEYDEALVCAELALGADPQLVEGLVLKADILRARGRHQEALDQYHLARSRGADAPELLLAMAELYLHANRPYRALTTLDRVPSDTLPAAQRVYVFRLTSTAYRALGRHDDEAETLQLALQVAPQDPELQLLLGQSLLAAGRYQESAELAYQMQQQAPAAAHAEQLAQLLRQIEPRMARGQNGPITR